VFILCNLKDVGAGNKQHSITTTTAKGKEKQCFLQEENLPILPQNSKI